MVYCAVLIHSSSDVRNYITINLYSWHLITSSPCSTRWLGWTAQESVVMVGSNNVCELEQKHRRLMCTVASTASYNVLKNNIFLSSSPEWAGGSHISVRRMIPIRFGALNNMWILPYGLPVFTKLSWIRNTQNILGKLTYLFLTENCLKIAFLKYGAQFSVGLWGQILEAADNYLPFSPKGRFGHLPLKEKMLQTFLITKNSSGFSKVLGAYPIITFEFLYALLRMYFWRKKPQIILSLSNHYREGKSNATNTAVVSSFFPGPDVFTLQ